MTNIILAGFSSDEQADSAITELMAHGFEPHDFSILAHQTKEHSGGDMAAGAATGTAAGATSGAATGGVIGSVAGLLAAAGVIPSIAGLIIGGPIVAALGLTGAAATVAGGAITGVAAGAATGGVIGLLTGAGLSESDAQGFKDIIDNEGFVIGIPVEESNEEEVINICNANHVTKLKAINIG